MSGEFKDSGSGSMNNSGNDAPEPMILRVIDMEESLSKYTEKMKNPDFLANAIYQIQMIELMIEDVFLVFPTTDRGTTAILAIAIVDKDPIKMKVVALIFAKPKPRKTTEFYLDKDVVFEDSFDESNTFLQVSFEALQAIPNKNITISAVYLKELAESIKRSLDDFNITGMTSFTTNKIRKTSGMLPMLKTNLAPCEGSKTLPATVAAEHPLYIANKDVASRFSQAKSQELLTEKKKRDAILIQGNGLLTHDALAQILPSQTNSDSLVKMDGHPWRKSVGESISVLPLTGGNRTFVNLKADYIRMTNAPTPGFMIEQVMKLSVVEEFDVTYFASFSPFHLREDQTDALLDDVQQRFDSADKKAAYFDYMKVYYDQLYQF